MSPDPLLRVFAPSSTSTDRTLTRSWSLTLFSWSDPGEGEQARLPGPKAQVGFADAPMQSVGPILLAPARRGNRRGLLSFIGCLPEVVQALAERDDRVDVGLGVDTEVDQERALGPLRRIHRGAYLLAPVDSKGRPDVGVGELDEVRHVAEFGLRPHSAVEVVLELADHPEGEVVEKDDLDVELVLDSDRQLLCRHHESAFARHAPDGGVRTAELGADGCRQREAHRARAARVEEQSRPVVVPPQGSPDLVLADVGDHDRFVAASLIHVDQHVLRLEVSVRVRVLEGMLLAPGIDLGEPLAAALVQLPDLWGCLL